MTTCQTAAQIHTHYECPICGNILPHEPAVPRFDAPCSECGYHLWCRRRFAGTEIELEVLPERTPEPWEANQLVESLISKDVHARVVVDFSRLEIVDSSFVARLVSMNRRLRSVGGQLVLSNLSPIIREMFAQLRLDRAFDIVESEPHAEA